MKYRVYILTNSPPSDVQKQHKAHKIGYSTRNEATSGEGLGACQHRSPPEPRLSRTLYSKTDQAGPRTVPRIPRKIQVPCTNTSNVRPMLHVLLLSQQ